LPGGHGQFARKASMGLRYTGQLRPKA